MNNSFAIPAKQAFIFAALLFLGFAQVWGQDNKLKAPAESAAEPAVLWKNEPFGDYDLSKEIIEKRDANAKHFRNADGTFTAHIAAGDIHYEENGQWKTIYHTIVPSGNGFENITNNHKTWYPATASGAIKTVLKNGAVVKDMLGMRMYYEVNGQAVQPQNIQSKTGKANFNELTYAGVYGNGIDLRLTQNTTKRKMDYIVQNKSALGNIPAGAKFLIFEESAELPEGWKATLKDNMILLADAAGKTQAVYEKPVFMETPKPHHHDHEHSHHDMHKKGENDSKNNFIGTYEIQQNGKTVVIRTKVPVSWLTNAERNFPLIIDPSMDFYPSNISWWTGTMVTRSTNQIPINFTSTTIHDVFNDRIFLGNACGDGIYDNSSYVDGSSMSSDDDGLGSGWIKFNTSTLPVPSNDIYGATVHMNVYSSYAGDGECYINVAARHMTTDPSQTGQDATRLSDIRDGVSYVNFNFRGSTGSRNFTLNNDSYAQIASGSFSVGLHTYDTYQSHHAHEYVLMRGYSHANKPFLRVSYNGECFHGVETTPNNTGPNNCANGSLSLGAGAYYDIPVTKNTYYNFSLNNNGYENIHATSFCAIPQNGDASGFGQNIDCWFSGETTLLRLAAQRTSSTWSGGSAVITYRHTEPSKADASGGGTYCYSPVTLTASGNCGHRIYWQIAPNGTDNSSGNEGATKQANTGETWYARINNNGCWGPASDAQQVTVQPGPTAPSPAGQWVVECYVGNNFNYYAGYYTETNLSYNTETRWAKTVSPSSANAASGSAYTGCDIPVHNHSYRYTRTNFDCKRYRFSVLGHEDDIYAFIDVNGNGIVDAEDFEGAHQGGGDNHLNLWEGWLTSNSKIIIETKGFLHDSYTSVQFEDITPSVTLTLPAESCVNAPFNLSATSGYGAYQWSGSGVNNANAAATTATPALTGSQTYGVTATISGYTCTISDSKNITVLTRPVPAFTVAPNAPVCRGQSAVYTVPSDMTEYTWNIQGSQGTTYNIVAGNTTSNSITLDWLEIGDKTVTVNYKEDPSGCFGGSPASNTVNVTFPVAPTLNTKSP